VPAQAPPVDPQRPVTALQWRCQAFAAAPAELLYRALALRSSVFVVEQRCIYQDLDGSDLESLLVTGSLHAETKVLATARVLPPASRFAEPSIGRVCTSATHRRLGLGRMLMTYAIRSARQHHPGFAIRISAQAYLRGFYASLGFEAVSPPYLEDGIEHLEMLLPRA
jgi:ElaA protein